MGWKNILKWKEKDKRKWGNLNLHVVHAPPFICQCILFRQLVGICPFWIFWVPWFPADSMANFPKLVEDIIQTSINTGPRGVVRLAQGVQAVIGVGSEWLADVSKLTSVQFPLWPSSWNMHYFMFVNFLFYHFVCCYFVILCVKMKRFWKGNVIYNCRHLLFSASGWEEH